MLWFYNMFYGDWIVFFMIMCFFVFCIHFHYISNDFLDCSPCVMDMHTRAENMLLFVVSVRFWIKTDLPPVEEATHSILAGRFGITSCLLLLVCLIGSTLGRSSLINVFSKSFSTFLHPSLQETLTSIPKHHFMSM